MTDTKAPMPPKGTMELYLKTKEAYKLAYPTLHTKKVGKNPAKGKGVGFMLQSLFGKSVWTLKDLNDEQLLKVLALSEKIIQRKGLKLI